MKKKRFKKAGKILLPVLAAAAVLFLALPLGHEKEEVSSSGGQASSENGTLAAGSESGSGKGEGQQQKDNTEMNPRQDSGGQTQNEKRGEDGLPDYSTMIPQDLLEDGETEAADPDDAAVDAPAGEFSGNLQNSGLFIRTIQPYTGTFIETNEDREGSEIATALLENCTGQMISLAVVTISAGDQEWVFQASAVPAGASVIVQEKNAGAYTDGIVSCKKVELAFEPSPDLMPDRVSVEELGENELKVTNLSDTEIPALRLFYKIKDSGVYFGGITYTVKLTDLSPGESQTVFPAHYAAGYAEILMIREYEE